MDKESKRLLIEDSTLLIDALKILSETGRRIVFLVNKGKLRGTLTYGDISRWILKDGNLNSPAYEAARLDPLFVRVGAISNADEIFSNNTDRRITALPVVDDKNNVVEILFKDKCEIRYEQIDVPVIIMAGGRGTRLYPYTKILPKPLIPIGEIPISEHIVNRFFLNGCTRFYFIVNYRKNMVKSYYNEIERSYEVHFVDEDIPLGTGGGLGLMKGLIFSTFILTNCDSFIDEDYFKIVKFHKEKRNVVTMVCSNKRYEMPYGVVETDSYGSLVSMQEKPSLSYLTNTGTYIVEPEVIDMIEPGISIGFPDVIKKVKEAGKNVGIYTVDDKSWLDMGQFDTMEEMKRRLDIKD